MSEAKREKFVEAVIDRIATTRHFDFHDYKRGTLKRRIERRMQDRNCRAPDQYLEILARDPTEIDALVSSMLIKVTAFFRDPEAWEALAGEVLPQLLAERRPGTELRVWSAGCATGEEAYSIAILLAEAMGPGFAHDDVKIFGTDIDASAVDQARRAHYTAQQVAGVRPELLERYFIKEGTGYTVAKELRRKVVFGVNNLVSDAPISRIDLLLCRNVFIYLEARLQKLVLTRFHYALRQHGVLMLGKSELIPFAAKLFDPVDLSRRIYRKDGKRDAAAAQQRLVGLLEQESEHRREEGAPLAFVEQFHRDVTQSLRMPVVVTAADGTVTAWNRAAAALWSRSEASVIGKKLTALSLPGFTGDVLIEKTTAVRDGRVDRERAEVSFAPPVDGRSRHFTVHLWPLRDDKEKIVGVLYLLEDMTQLRELEAEYRHVSEERQSAFEELQTTNEEMQSSNEELETTNEELQSANEELQTTNEELQSTNEELETTNEELQSTNAELDATNRELAHRTDEMNSFWFSQRTIIRSLSAAVVLIDAEGRVTMWNLAAERLLGIAEPEAVGQTLWTLHVPALPRSVLARVRKRLTANRALRGEEIEYELPSSGRGYTTLTAVPIVEDRVRRGAVLLLEDCTKQVLLEREIERLRTAGAPAPTQPRKPTAKREKPKARNRRD